MQMWCGSQRFGHSIAPVFGLVLLLAGCAPISVHVQEAEPFPPLLATFLDDPTATRQEVHHWLGEPSTTRQNGRLEIFAAQQESWREYPRISDADNTYHYHYLLIRYDGSGLVSRHDLLVDAGCSADGLCVNDRRCLGQAECPENITAFYRYPDQMKATAAQLLAAKIEKLVIYAPAEDDERTKNTLPAVGECGLFVLRDESLPLVRVALPNERPLTLPAQGYFAWQGPPGHYDMTVEWSNWKQEYQTRSVGVDCPAGASGYVKLGFVKVKTMGWRYDLQPQELLPSSGVENLRGKNLVLR
jgi:hypothetical protein